MITTIRKWGNSLGIRIPKAIAQDAQFEEGMAVDVRQRGDQIVLKPVDAGKYELDGLLEKVSGENLHTEADTGSPQGTEAW